MYLQTMILVDIVTKRIIHWMHYVDATNIHQPIEVSERLVSSIFWGEAPEDFNYINCVNHTFSQQTNLVTRAEEDADASIIEMNAKCRAIELLYRDMIVKQDLLLKKLPIQNKIYDLKAKSAKEYLSLTPELRIEASKNPEYRLLKKCAKIRNMSLDQYAGLVNFAAINFHQELIRLEVYRESRLSEIMNHAEFNNHTN